MGTPKGMDTDHIDGNKLNNQKTNLRIATRTENARNQRPVRGGSSQYKGVGWHKAANKWRADIRINGELKYLGLFTDEIQAAKSYNEAATKYFGEFAQINKL